MKKFLLAVSIFFSNYLLAEPFAIVVNQGSGNATIIDVATLTPINTVTCGGTSVFVAITSDGNLALVTNNAFNNVTAIDLKTFATTGIPLGPGGINPVGIVITPDNKKALVCNQSSSQVSVIDLQTLTAQAPINIGGPGVQTKNAIVIAAGIPSVPDLALVVNGNNSVTPINLSTLTPLANIPTGATPQGIVISRAHKMALIANRSDNTISRIDLTTLTALPPIVLTGNSFNIFISESLDLALVANDPNFVTPINLSTMTPLAPITVGSSPSYIGILNNRAFVANLLSNTVTPIDLVSFTALASIPVGTFPVFAVPTPVLNPVVLVGNFGLNTLSVIDPVTLTTGPDITVGSEPNDIGFFTPTTITISSPSNFSGKQEIAKSLFQKDFVNILSWNAPASGSAAFYKLYRDSALTDLIAVLNGNETKYFDHDRKKGVVYTYFIVAVDSSGNVSSASSTSVP